jgi:hypothetical protein
VFLLRIAVCALVAQTVVEVARLADVEVVPKHRLVAAVAQKLVKVFWGVRIEIIGNRERIVQKEI